MSTSAPVLPPVASSTGHAFKCGAGMMDDPEFSTRDKQYINLFRQETDRRLASHGRACNHSMFSICEASHIDLTLIQKDGPLMIALWVTLLSALSCHPEFNLASMKYPTFESFQEAYAGWFLHELPEEKTLLWHTANWMHILFQIIPAKKNKGLAMQVIPKLIEGWDAKYVTGSGQTRLTANRVHIFETEGNTKPSHRGGKVSKGKKKVAGASKRYGKASMNKKLDNAYDSYQQGKRRKRRSSSFSKKSTPASAKKATTLGLTVPASLHESVYIYNYSSSDDEDDLSDEFEENEGEEGMEIAVDDIDAGHTDVDDDSLQNEMKSVFESFAKSPLPPLNREETSCLELLRSQSMFSLDLTPSKLERGYSWTEIPVCNSANSHPADAGNMINTTESSSSNSCMYTNTTSYYPFTSPVPMAWSNATPMTCSSSSSTMIMSSVEHQSNMMQMTYTRMESPYPANNMTISTSSNALDSNAIMDMFMGYSVGSPIPSSTPCN